jgi:hypothetical protein
MDDRTPRGVRLLALSLTSIASKLGSYKSSAMDDRTPRGCQAARVIVDVHRERARSYKSVPMIG